MSKQKRHAKNKLTPKQRIERLTLKQQARELTYEAKRAYYDNVVRPQEERELREQRREQNKINRKIDERDRNRRLKELEVTRYSSQKPKARFIHPR